MTFTLQMLDDQTMAVQRHGETSHVQVRGAPRYVAEGYNAADPLHAFLDSLDPGTVSAVLTYVPVVLNPYNRRAVPTFAACEKLLDNT